MTVRKQTLEEWFTQYQLTALQKTHFHLPYDLEIDVTRLVRSYEARGERAPLTALIVKAAALTAVAHPAVNRAVLRTLLGTRVVQFSKGHVNLPVMMERDGKRHLSATVVRQAERLSIADINAEIGKARARRMEDLPIGKHFIANHNTLLGRMQLRARHVLAYSVPAFYERFGGGISVSSLLRPSRPGVVVRVPSYGPTALSLCPTTLRSEAGRSTLFMGAGYDHYACSGLEATEALEHFGALLAAGDPAHFEATASASQSLNGEAHVP